MNNNIMDLLQQVAERAKAGKQRIVLPETLEEQILRAADRILADDIADIILTDNPTEIHKMAEVRALKNIDKATVINPENDPKSEEYTTLLVELRKKKGAILEQVRELVRNPSYLGYMIIETEGTDGQISGALSTTRDTLHPALQIVKCTSGVTCVSGTMLLITQAKEYGGNGVVTMGDVVATPAPDMDQLAQIAVTTAEAAKNVAGFREPCVTTLSFPTKGSASHEIVVKMAEATELTKRRVLQLKIDGELQADAALVISVGWRKVPGGAIAGNVNVLVIPNLGVGNISYKLVQRSGNAIVIGPILQGVVHPVNGLSRGYPVGDIYYMVTITVCQAQDAKEEEQE